jgi:hypothetical protein
VITEMGTKVPISQRFPGLPAALLTHLEGKGIHQTYHFVGHFLKNGLSRLDTTVRLGLQQWDEELTPLFERAQEWLSMHSGVILSKWTPKKRFTPKIRRNVLTWMMASRRRASDAHSPFPHIPWEMWRCILGSTWWYETDTGLASRPFIVLGHPTPAMSRC